MSGLADQGLGVGERGLRREGQFLSFRAAGFVMTRPEARKQAGLG